MKKRILALLLAAALAFEMGEIPAMAQTVDTTPMVESGSWVNPIYEGDQQTLNDFTEEGVASTGATTYSSTTSAAAYVKKRMMARAQTIEFNYRASSSTSYKTILDSIAKKAYKITSNPQEGDYLRYHVYGYKYNINYSIRTDGTVLYSIKLIYTYQSTAAEENAMKTGIASAVSSLAMTKDSDLQKVKKIHDYICARVSYDNTMSKHSAYDALYGRSAVCQGYSNLFYGMCVKAGIQVRQITGDSDGNGKADHIWNIVKIGSQWYNVDTTWDSQSGEVIYRFFLKSNADFGIHIRDAEFDTASFNSSYPMTQTSYNGSVGNTKITKVSSAGYNALTISWNKVSTATRYDVYYSTSKKGNWKKASTSSGGVTAVVLSKLKTGVTYYIKVRPVSDLSGEDVFGSFTAIASSKPVPAKVSVKSVAPGSKKLKVTWKKVAGASGYEIYYTYKYKGKTVKKTITVKSGSILKKTISKLPKGVKVSVKVRAYRNVSGKRITGSYSATKKVTIK